MLFMVIEHFKGDSTAAIGDRFRRSGRMLPQGVAYHASWIDRATARCFQLMEAEHADLLDPWIRCWNDLIDFEVVPVIASSEVWSKLRTAQDKSRPR